MKNRRFYKTSFGSFLIQGICLFALLGCINCYIFIIKRLISRWGENTTALNIFLLVVLFVAFFVFLYDLIGFYIGVISLETEGIRTKGDIRLRIDKIQYPAYVRYISIQSVSIVPYRKNSRGGNTRFLRPFPYLFISSNNKTYKFALVFMSPGTVRKLLIGLKERCSLCGNDVQMDIDELVATFRKTRWATKE